jgi:hypothetical protein
MAGAGRSPSQLSCVCAGGGGDRISVIYWGRAVCTVCTDGQCFRSAFGLNAFFPDPDPAVCLSAAADSDPVPLLSLHSKILYFFCSLKLGGARRNAWPGVTGVAQLQASSSISC